MTDRDIEMLNYVFPQVSGRDIKELIKLASRYIRVKGAATEKDVVNAYVACSAFRQAGEHKSKVQ